MIKITHGAEIILHGILKVILFLALLFMVLSIFIDIDLGRSINDLDVFDFMMLFFWVIYEDSYIRNQYRNIGIDNIGYKVLTAYLNEHFLVHKSISEIEALIASDKGLQKSMLSKTDLKYRFVSKSYFGLFKRYYDLELVVLGQFKTECRFMTEDNAIKGLYARLNILEHMYSIKKCLKVAARPEPSFLD